MKAVVAGLFCLALAACSSDDVIRPSPTEATSASETTASANDQRPRSTAVQRPVSKADNFCPLSTDEIRDAIELGPAIDRGDRDDNTEAGGGCQYHILARGASEADYTGSDDTSVALGLLLTWNSAPATETAQFWADSYGAEVSDGREAGTYEIPYTAAGTPQFMLAYDTSNGSMLISLSPPYDDDHRVGKQLPEIAWRLYDALTGR